MRNIKQSSGNSEFVSERGMAYFDAVSIKLTVSENFEEMDDEMGTEVVAQ